MFPIQVPFFAKQYYVRCRMPKAYTKPILPK